MKTVKEVSCLSGVSIRTLHYYDSIGLLHPTKITESGYRLYDDTALEKLQFILLFREFQFSLKEIKEIIDSPVFDRNRALSQQIELLHMRKEHIENLIDLARGIQMIGVKKLDFSAFDTKKIDNYAAQAKATWGTTEAYKEFEKKTSGRSAKEQSEINISLMNIFKQFGNIRSLAPDCDEAQALAASLQQFITDKFYTCTPEIFKSLGIMYAGGGSITENIDKSSGDGTAVFSAKAIDVYCEKLKKR